MLEFQSFTPSDDSWSLNIQRNEAYQKSYKHSQLHASDQVSETGSGCSVMTDRRWTTLPEGQELQREVEQQPVSMPAVQVQQSATCHTTAASSHLQATQYPSPSIYPTIDPALAAGYYQYGQNYGASTAFRFPPPQRIQNQPSFATSAFNFGRASFMSDISGSAGVRPYSFQRPRLQQLGRTFSSPETPTPPTVMMPAPFSAPASAGLFPPPPIDQQSHSLGAAERATGSAAMHPFFDPYHTNVSGFLLQHHPQQHLGTQSPVPSEGHTPSTAAGISGQAMPLLSPFGDTAFLFQAHPSSATAFGQIPLSQSQAVTCQQHLICAVCGDTAACSHYGVRTCEGCKGFFKRTVQKNAKYICLGNRDCVIDKRRRNRCQYCRFQKCLNVGMVKEVVRTDTMKGRRGRLPSKSKVPGLGEEAGPSGSGAVIIAQSLTKALVYAYAGNGTAHLAVSSVRLGTSDQFVDSLRVGLQEVHQYAERLPDWAEISDHDRALLLKKFGISALSLRWAYRSMAVAGDEKLLSDDGLVFRTDECPVAWRTWFQSIRTLSLHFRSSLELDVTSFSCLCALSLVFQDCSGLQQVEEVDKLKNNIINCLKEHCAYAMEAKTKPQYFARILSVLSDLNTISQYARQAYSATFGDRLEDRPSTSALAPVSLTLFDESFLE